MALTVIDARNYLIKGCKPYVLRPGEQMQITREGPLQQRRWMVVDAASHIFRSQRHRGFERLTLLQPSLEGDTLHLQMEGEDISVPTEEGGPMAHVKIWEAMVPAIVHTTASAWLSDQLHQYVLLVRKCAQRPINSIYAPEADTVSFSDRFPLTLLSTAAVEQIKAAFDEGIEADRFRYNVLFTGSTEREEHHLARFTIGSFIGCGVKPCGRCNTINVDQATAAVDATILQRLHAHPAFLNPHSGEVVVSENATVEREGAFTLGDAVTVLQRRAEGWDRPYDLADSSHPTTPAPPVRRNTGASELGNHSGFFPGYLTGEYCTLYTAGACLEAGTSPVDGFLVRRGRSLTIRTKTALAGGDFAVGQVRRGSRGARRKSFLAIGT